MNIIRQLLSKISLSTLLALLAGIFSYRASSNKHQRIKAEEKNDEYESVIHDVEQAREISNDVDALPDTAVADELQSNDWYRDD